jgi:3-oxoacyl-[acyl-carrier-protein] synthase II
LTQARTQASHQGAIQASNRRVVITGLGLLCGVGNTAPEVWRQLLAGASGMAPIQGFDATGFPVTFAAEVKNFDPLNFVEK